MSEAGKVIEAAAGRWPAARSEQYIEAIAGVQKWFAERLPALPEIHISSAEYLTGTDALKRSDLKALINEAFRLWLEEYKYELSYSQMCRAFFGAASGCGKLFVA